MKKELTALVLAAGLLSAKSQGNFSVGYSPTGIAYDSVNNVISLAGSGGVNTYGTNGTLQTSFGQSGISDLGSGNGGNVWIANGTSADKRLYNGSGITSTAIPNNTVAIGGQLTIGGIDYLMFAVNGGNVSALNLNNNQTTTLMATPANITGGDWIMRPGGSSLNDVLLAFNNDSTVNTYFGNGNPYLSMPLSQDDYGDARDVAFGNNQIWVAQDQFGSGNAVPYAFTIQAVPEPNTTTLGLFGLGILGYGALRRSMNKK